MKVDLNEYKTIAQNFTVLKSITPTEHKVCSDIVIQSHRFNYP